MRARLNMLIAKPLCNLENAERERLVHTGPKPCANTYTGGPTKFRGTICRAPPA